MKNKALATNIAFLILFLLSQTTSAVPPQTFSAMHPVFSKNNAQLIYLGGNRNQAEIIKIDSATGKILKTTPLKLSNNLSPFAATPDGFKFLATTPKGIAVIHNGTGKVLRTLPYPSNANDAHYSSVQSRDGVILGVASLTPQARRIDLVHTGSGKIVHSVDLLKGEKWTRYPKVKGLGFSYDRRLLAYEFQSLNKASLHLYDIYKKKEIFRVDLPAPIRDHNFTEIKFSKNGQFLVLSAADKKGITLVNLHNQSVHTLNYDYSDFVGFNPDDKLIIVQSHKNRISIFNTQTGQVTSQPFKFQNHNGRYTGAITQSADRSILALAIRIMDPSKINQLALINTRTGQLLRRIGQQ